jgi:hypothetical protein
MTSRDWRLFTVFLAFGMMIYTAVTPPSAAWPGWMLATYLAFVLWIKESSPIQPKAPDHD